VIDNIKSLFIVYKIFLCLTSLDLIFPYFYNNLHKVYPPFYRLTQSWQSWTDIAALVGLFGAPESCSCVGRAGTWAGPTRKAHLRRARSLFSEGFIFMAITNAVRCLWVYRPTCGYSSSIVLCLKCRK